jgi:hypothetical protein
MNLYSYMATHNTSILVDFPKIKLSYETFTHKKVFDANVVLAIPIGKKCFAWFTTKNDKNVCYILEIGAEKQIEKYHLVTCCFHESLSVGTILYGTLFFHEKRRFFTIEDVIYYKGKNIQSSLYLDKLRLFETIFTTDLGQNSYSSSFITFGLPMMSNDTNTLLTQIDRTQRIMYFQYRYFNKPMICRVKSYIVMQANDSTMQQSPPPPPQLDTPVINKPITQTYTPTYTHTPTRPQQRTNNKQYPVYERVFSIKPDLQNDIYHLSDPVNKSLVGTAYIPDYKTSVMMNQLFRNIKENANLDSLEESDSEDEFENDRVDKFVYLDREYTMICVYNHKFKKWVPLRVADN